MNSDWPLHRIADLCESIDYGYTQSATDEPIGPKFLRITDIVGESLSWSSVPHCRADTATLNKYKLNHGDIVIARTGATTGSSAYIANPPSAVFASYLIRLKTTPACESRFLAYSLKSRAYANYIEGVLGDKSAQPNASAKTLTQAYLRLPPLAEQRAIAHVLGTLDDKIELNRRMNETLESMARALFKSWFVDFDPVRAKAEGRRPICHPDVADLFPRRFTRSESGLIPQGWTLGILGQVAKNARRAVNPADIEEDTPYIGLEHMPKASIALGEWGRAGEVASGKNKFQMHEVLFGKLRPYFHKVGLAPVNGVCSTDILTVAPISTSWLGFVLFHMSSIELINHADACSTGTKMPRVNWSDLARYEIALPTGEIAAAFEELATPMLGRIITMLKESRTLIEVREALLPKLLSGELRIRDAEKIVEAHV